MSFILLEELPSDKICQNRFAFLPFKSNDH